MKQNFRAGNFGITGVDEEPAGSISSKAPALTGLTSNL